MKVERDLVGLVGEAAAEATPGATASLLRCRDWSSSLFCGVRLTIEIAADEDESFEA